MKIDNGIFEKLVELVESDGYNRETSEEQQKVKIIIQMLDDIEDSKRENKKLYEQGDTFSRKLVKENIINCANILQTLVQGW